MNQVIKVMIVLLLLLPNIAWGYIDPGSGSAIMSAIIGFFVVIGLAVKNYWYKLKSMFTSKKTTEVSMKNDSGDES